MHSNGRISSSTTLNARAALASLRSRLSAFACSRARPSLTLCAHRSGGRLSLRPGYAYALPGLRSGNRYGLRPGLHYSQPPSLKRYGSVLRTEPRFYRLAPRAKPPKPPTKPHHARAERRLTPWFARAALASPRSRLPAFACSRARPSLTLCAHRSGGRLSLRPGYAYALPGLRSGNRYGLRPGLHYSQPPSLKRYGSVLRTEPRFYRLAL